MTRESHYGTITEALEQLRKRGFTVDFNLKENCIVCHPHEFNADEFEIVDIYRYEGDTDPADETTVYAIESTNGIKGVLVNGYGASSDSMSAAMLSKLKIRK
jgi:hypothetical protein